MSEKIRLAIPLVGLLLLGAVQPVAGAGATSTRTSQAAKPPAMPSPSATAPASVTTTAAVNNDAYNRLEIQQLILRQAYRLHVATPLALAVARVSSNP